MKTEVMGRCDQPFRKQLHLKLFKHIRKTSSFVAGIDVSVGERQTCARRYSFP